MRLLLVGLLLLTSCTNSAPPAPNVPPAPSSVDLNLSKSLLVAQTAIEQAKTLVPSHPAIKDQLNQVIAGYNLAETAYISFHADVVAGKSPDPTVLQAQILDIVQKAQALTK